MSGSHRLRYAFKTALAAVIAVGLAMLFRWDRPYWSGISVLVVMLPYVGASIEKSLFRLVGTWLGALAGVIMTAVFAQSPFLFTVSLAVVMVIGIYLARSNYGVIMGVGTMAIIVFSGLQDPHRVWHFACFRSAEVSLGVVVALFMQFSLWPRKAGTDLLESPREILRDLQAYLDAVVGLFTTSVAGKRDLDLRRTGLLDCFLKMERLLDLAVRESFEIKRKQEWYRSLIYRLKAVLISLSTLRQCLEGEMSAEYRAEFEKELGAFADSARRELEIFAAALGGGRLEGASDYGAKLEDLRERLDGLRRRRVPHRYPQETSLRVLAFVSSLSDLADSLASTRETIEGIVSGAPPPVWRAVTRPAPRSFKPDPERLKRGVRVAAGILIAMYGWWYFRWPSGMQAIISFIVVTGQPHIAEVNIKSITRLTGALIGCSIALLSCIYIIPHLESYWGLGILLFCVLFTTSFINSGPPRYAYTGFQAGLCYLLTVAQGFHKEVTFMPALNRAVGIMLGALLGAAAVRFIFPPAPRRELCRDLERLFGLFRTSLEEMMKRPVPHGVGRALSDRSPVILNRCREWLSQMNFFGREEEKKVSYLLPVLQVLSFRLIALCRARAGLGPHSLLGRLETALGGLHLRIEEMFKRCRNAFEAEEHEGPIPDLERVRGEVGEELQRIRREGETLEALTEEVCRNGALVVAYMNLAGDVESCAGIVTGFDFEAWDPEIPM